MKTPNPPKNNNKFLWKIFMRCLKQTARIATTVDVNVVNMIGRNTSEGLFAPNCARYIIIVIGINVSPEALIHKNIIIGLLADALLVFISWSSFMAFNPIGVAALSSPNRLADKFINIDPVTG